MVLNLELKIEIHLKYKVVKNISESKSSICNLCQKCCKMIRENSPSAFRYSSKLSLEIIFQ